ncbi:hypothetical protein CGRA01v4_00190 [Colletotrichum graminicola]|nr:hypothetical protein CGRA01v4_00190 [Colletotrichum graminicola]
MSGPWTYSTHTHTHTRTHTPLRSTHITHTRARAHTITITLAPACVCGCFLHLSTLCRCAHRVRGEPSCLRGLWSMAAFPLLYPVRPSSSTSSAPRGAPPSCSSAGVPYAGPPPPVSGRWRGGRGQSRIRS